MLTKMKIPMICCTLLVYCSVITLSSDIRYTISNENILCENQSSCLSMSELGNMSHIDKVHLQLSPGKHIFSKHEFLAFEDVNEVYLIGTADSTEIICTNSTGIMFSSVGTVVIANVSMMHCGALGNMSVSGAHHPIAVILHSISDIHLTNVRILESKAIGVFVSETYGVAHIQNSVINGSRMANIICLWDSNYNSEHNSSISFTVENVIIAQGGKELSDGDIAMEVSGGMNIQTNNVLGDILLNNVTFSENTGFTGGNVRVNVSRSVKCSEYDFLNITLSNGLLSHGLAASGAGVLLTGKFYDNRHNDSLNYTCCHRFVVSDTTILNNQVRENGGGMAIFIDESVHGIDISVQNVMFISNTILSRSTVDHSRYFLAGGGLFFHLVESSQYHRNTPILQVNQCTFQYNFAHTGAGLYITIEKISYSRVPNSLRPDKIDHFIIISESEIIGNTADIGAGAVMALHDTWLALHTGMTYLIHVTSNRFENNKASAQASGLHISSLADSSFELNLHNTSFINNHANGMLIDSELSSTLSLNSVNNLSIFNCTFFRNVGSAIRAALSVITVTGPLNISYNIASVGAGMSLVSSYLKVEARTLTFESNHASKVGGAIYSRNSHYTSSIYRANDDLPIQFNNNSGILGGAILYESGYYLLNNSQFLRLSNESRSLFASDPYQVCICMNDMVDCDSSSISLSIIRGTSLVFSSTLRDWNGLSTLGYISVANKQRKFYSKVNECSEIMLPVPTSRQSEHITLLPTNYRHYFPDSYKPLDIFLSFLPCPSGFVISQDGTKCDCLPYFKTSNLLQCNVSDFTFMRRGEYWVGLDHNNTIRSHDLCPYGYCASGSIKLFDLNNRTSLCTSQRSGILCGECNNNLSLTLGGDDCIECTNNYIALLLVFCCLGVLLIAIVTLLSFTIGDGAINGVIFYAAFLHLNKNLLFLNYSNGNLFVIFISWLNLDFGFNVCFYNGLTSYMKVWLQFIFPLSLYVTEIIVNISSYRSSKLARITGARNRMKIMATLFLLGYIKILRAVMSVLPYANLRSLNNSSDIKTVWLYDGNIEYYSRHHTPLFVVAVSFLIIVSVPYTFSLLFVQLLRRLPHFPCKTSRNAITDAHVGPFKTKFRFWLGLLLISYTFLVTLHCFTGGDRNTNLTALTVTCSLLLLLNILFGGVYKNRILNALESLFLFNLVIISAIFSGSSTGNIRAILYLLVSVGFITIVVTIVYHLYTNVCIKDNEGNICAYFFTQKLWKRSRHPHYETLSEEGDFEAEYENADTLIGIDGQYTVLGTSNDIELVPTDWLPTNYPVPEFREDLLNSNHDADVKLPTISSATPSEKLTPEHTQVRSSLLVVDQRKDEVNLIANPNLISRLQHLSVDISGDRAYIIEDSTHQTGGIVTEQIAITCSASTAAQQVNKEGKVADLVTKESKNKLPIEPTGDKSRANSRRSRSRLLRSKVSHKSRARISKRPQYGTLCYKCDPSLFLHSKITRFKVNANGRECPLKAHDITVKIPPLAIKGHTFIDFEVGVMLNGPFVFPQNVRPISPILWICTRNKVFFCKPVEIILPHFVRNLDNNEDAKKLGIQFMKASHHHSHQLTDGTKKFTFDCIENESTAHFTTHLGKLTTLHFCFFCIVASESRALYEHASYCLTRVDPIAWSPSQRKQEIHFVISFFMKTCLQVS